MEPITTTAVLTVSGAAIVTTMIVQLIKTSMGDAAVTFMPRYGPLLAVAIGVLLVVAATLATGGDDLLQAALTGLVAGTSAIGVYEAIKSPSATTARLA